ncbi:MAG: protease pro-enzyme activation domain-containing protein [Candidatus Binataceae bacterium]
MYRWFIFVLVLPLLVILLEPSHHVLKSAPADAATVGVVTTMVRLPGHVSPDMSKATRNTSSAASGAKPMALTIVLRRDDQPAFDQYLHDVYDPHAESFHHYLSQRQIADRFGPTQRDYQQVLGYLEANGLSLIEGAKNRLTITVRGTRAQVERVFVLQIDDYRLGKTEFFGSEQDPALPRDIASHVQAVVGLSNLSRPRSVVWALRMVACKIIASLCASASGATSEQNVWNACVAATNKGNSYDSDGVLNICGTPTPVPGAISTPSMSKISTRSEHSGPLAQPNVMPPWTGIDGTGQTIGLVEFDNFEISDVQNYLAFVNEPASLIDNLSVVNVNGGTTPGPGQEEVLLDIAATLTMAPGAKTVVYDAPFSGAGASFQSVFNQMINDKVSIISNSWAYCEDQTTQADAQSLDTILQNAAMAGITVFNGAGDTGSTCLDGSPNTIAVPADSPNATAVGGSSEPEAPGLLYAPETWWDGSASTPPSGQGGFGTSKFFAATSYQRVLTGSSMRMIPDVVINADPANGIYLCQASAGGCPTGLTYGGTSLAAPEWAALTALLNEAQGTNLGFLNPLIYPLANTNAFHGPAALSSDFVHVGLGSPNLNVLHLMLSDQTAGTPSASLSEIGVSTLTPASGIISNGVPADGSTQALVVVALRDANGNAVSGKYVSLTANSGSSAIINPPNAETTVDNGAVTFTLTDLTPENLTLTATDTSDSVELSQKGQLDFLTPSAASAGLNAFPNSVTADGASATTIQVTLTDSLGRPTPGKLINISQGSGNSTITGPGPSVTDSNGQVTFTATDQAPETVTYSAVDVTDGNLPFPTTGTVSFVNGPANGCGNASPVAAPGFLVNTYANGVLAQNFFYGDVNFAGCPGAAGLAFDSSGNLYVSEASTGNIYKIPPGGGTAGSSTLLTTTPIGPAVAGLAIDTSGNLYAGRAATTGNFFTGAVLQIDTSTGAVIRNVASNLTCPSFLSVDPLSGDIFVDDSCSGAGSDNTALWRISNPTSGSPTVSVYANLPTTPNASISFLPNGNMYIWSDGSVIEVTGTNGPATPVVTTLSGVAMENLGLFAQGVQPNGDAQVLTLGLTAIGNAPASTGQLDLTTTLPTPGISLFNGSAEVLTPGPDGCV